jgi:DNA polymerase I-like protein with 3'-5' exonuclease and polymerase domains
VGYGLADVAKRYLNVTITKDTRGDFFKLQSEPFTDEQIRYAAKDVEHLHDIAKKQYVELAKYDLLYAVNIENQAVKALADIEYNGMFLDPAAWRKNAIDFEEALHKTIFDLDSFILNNPSLGYSPVNFGHDLFSEPTRMLNINYASPKQVLDLLNRCGLKPPNTNDRELNKLSKKHAIIPLLQAYRKAAKIVSTYGLSFLNNINTTTGRVHSDFWQILDTYRISSNNPNLQNIPKENVFRTCFKPRPGYKWVSIDYQAQELRIMADLSGEDGFIDVLNRGEDLHCYAGSMMFKKPVTKQDKDLRNKAKTINFGIIFVAARS